MRPLSLSKGSCNIGICDLPSLSSQSPKHPQVLLPNNNLSSHGLLGLPSHMPREVVFFFLERPALPKHKPIMQKSTWSKSCLEGIWETPALKQNNTGKGNVTL